MKKYLLTILLICFSSIVFAQERLIAQIVSQNSDQTTQLAACINRPLTLSAAPNSDSLTYQWLRNGEIIPNVTSSSITITDEGVYQTILTYKSYSSKSSPVVVLSCNQPIPPKTSNTNNTISASTPYISCPNSVICGANTSAILTANPQNASYAYQWYSSTSQYGTYSAISGATSSTYTTNAVGWFKVFVNDGVNIPQLSTELQISSTGYAVLSDLSGNRYPTINTTPNTAVAVKATFYGEPPFSFSIYDGVGSKSYTTSSNPYQFNISSDQNKIFSINNFTNACSSNSSSSYGSIYFVVDNTTSLTLSSISSTNICAGETINIPYTTTGTWKTQRKITIGLIESTTNNWITSNSNQFTNPMQLTIPSNLAVGSTYKLMAYGNPPYTSSSSYSTYTLTVTSTGCTPKATLTTYPSNVSCGMVQFNAFPQISGNLYEWYKDNVLVASTSFNFYNTTQNGTYKVKITNPSTGFNSTSIDYPITISLNNPTITCSNPVLCGSNTSATLNSSITGSGYIYQWSYSSSIDGTYTVIPNSTNSSYTTSIVGFYKLQISNNVCTIYSSNTVNISKNPYLELRNSIDTFSDVSINSGQSTTLKVYLYGSPPFTFSYYENNNYHIINTNNSVYTLTVAPIQTTTFSVGSFNSSCYGTNNNYNTSIKVIVLPAPTFTLTTPAIVAVCPGGRLALPYTTSGTLNTSRKFYLEMRDANNNYVNNSYFYNTTNNNVIYYDISSAVAPGTYKIYASLTDIYSATSSYSITVTNTGCSIPNARIEYSPNSCYTNSLYAYPNNNNLFTYQWYKDGVAINGAISTNYYPSINGNYTVNIQNNSGYNSTSPSVAINTLGFSGSTATNSSYCTNSSNTLSANSTVSGNSYQWYFSATGNGYSPIAGATSSSYVANQGGAYKVIIKNGQCEIEKDFKCPILIPFESQTICQGSGLIVPLNTYLSSVLTLQLLNASTNAVVNANLATASNNQFAFNLPNNTPVGTYKFKVVSSGGTESPISVGTLTVTSGSSVNSPTLTANPSLINNSQYVTLTANGCNGTVTWLDNFSSATTRNVYLNWGALYKAYCNDGTCNSTVSEVRVYYNCGDTMEPNDNTASAKQITGDSFTSGLLCFDASIDQDWFSLVVNGKKYYLKAKLWGNYNINTSPYHFKKTLSGNILTLETVADVTGTYIDTELFLYSADGLTQLAYDDQGNGNGLSKIVYNIDNQCQTNVNLTSTFYDIFEGETSTVRAYIIEASNKVKNSAIATYQAQNSILLSPGFETQINTSGYFKAEINSCN